MRAVAVLASYNEERFIANCLEHLFRHGFEVYLIDNCSTDRTVAIADGYRGRGLIDIETFHREEGVEPLFIPLMRRKEEVIATLDADWFLHADLDEVRLPPRSGITLADALADVDAQGYNAVNFMEFTFIPTREAPDHDHPDYLRTMRWYYPYAPRYPNRLNAWKRQSGPVELASSGGHLVRFPNLRMYPESFPMRHYQILGVKHLLGKYGPHRYPPAHLMQGRYGWRARIDPMQAQFPSQTELREYTSDDELDDSNPRMVHYAAQFPQVQPTTYQKALFRVSNMRTWLGRKAGSGSAP